MALFLSAVSPPSFRTAAPAASGPTSTPSFEPFRVAMPEVASGRWSRTGIRPVSPPPATSSAAGRPFRSRFGPAQPRRHPPRGHPSRRRLRGWLSRNRRFIAALLFCIPAGLTVQQLAPPPADTVAAFAAAADLPAGKTLEPGDVSRISVPPGLVPAGNPGSETAFEGKQLAAPLRQGQFLTDAQILGPGLLAGSPPGSAAVPLRMADPASIQLVSPGQLVNVVLTGGNGTEQPGESQVLAEAVPVLWTSAQGGKAGPWPAAAETDGLVVVAAPADQARRLAGASTQGKLFFVLVASPPG
ncbi:RcpC/CpaB family pilus assembly protein [Arthrobacter sp. 131MFCol6.1]|uniref:RcpC/CpaB family pilus assembly protein n=1 Tax=Arthrobacter sp. 131MFCol6.1 TaxID=1157944 RepID=UPI001E335B19|nr:Flp pilus assembly protein CpaB [Arthrobacter sp. 131MFCol6.1]